MDQRALKRLYWGFLFVMIDITIVGFDIFPDIVGYILFAVGLSSLVKYSAYFSKAYRFNIPMIILSVLSILNAIGINIYDNYSLSTVIFLATLILNLLIVQNIFLGIGEVEKQLNQVELVKESVTLWKKFVIYQIAVLFSFVVMLIPAIAFIYLIVLLMAGLILTYRIMNFIRRCSISFDVKPC